MANELAVRSDVPMELSVTELQAQVQKIQQVMKSVMHDGEHYGVIPGTPKPTLYKAGAEKLCLLFRLNPQFESTETHDGDHLTVKSKCTLYHIPTGMQLGSGEGSCSTKESKYAYRNASLSCPECGKDAIIKGREEYGGGWLCFKKKGGCGSKFPDDHFKGVEVGKVAADNLPDQYNTVLKMANKRALVAAVLVTTAASDIFTQDVEDLPQFQEKKAEDAPGSTISRPPNPQAQPAAKERQGPKAELRTAILDFVNNDKKAASELLWKIAKTRSINDMTDQQASMALEKFKKDVLDDIPDFAKGPDHDANLV